jgi:hypothetical protein
MDIFIQTTHATAPEHESGRIARDGGAGTMVRDLGRPLPGRWKFFRVLRLASRVATMSATGFITVPQ